VLDGKRHTYWTTDDGQTTARLTLRFDKPTTFNVADMRERLPLGQRVRRWEIEQWQGQQWKMVGQGQSIGNRRLWRGEAVTTRRVRLTVSGPVAPAISEFGLYQAPAKVIQAGRN